LIRRNEWKVESNLQEIRLEILRACSRGKPVLQGSVCDSALRFPMVLARFKLGPSLSGAWLFSSSLNEPY
jgi:hypothetical protein